jgi:hypothetical protein
MASKYDRLRGYLNVRSGPVLVTFKEIEKILGGPLPASARKHRAWWANEAGDSRHVQSRAWLGCGRKVVNVNMTAERVEFSN